MSHKGTIRSVIDDIVGYQEEGAIEGIAFVIVRPGEAPPIIGHANASYELLAAMELAKTNLAFKMLSEFEDVDSGDTVVPPPDKQN